MEYLNTQSLYMPLLTLAGVVGFGSLEVPQLFQDLLKHPLVQWMLIFVLVMQGGSGGNVQLAAVATAVLFIIFKLADMLYTKKDGYSSY